MWRFDCIFAYTKNTKYMACSNNVNFDFDLSSCSTHVQSTKTVTVTLIDAEPTILEQCINKNAKKRKKAVIVG